MVEVNLNAGPLNTTPASAPSTKADDFSTSQLHDLIPFVSHDRAFAVFTDQVEGMAENKPCAPLPHAPVAVVGVVCLHGRMLTVLDPAALLAPERPPGNLPHVIALRGDEQFALAAEICSDTITVSAEDIEPASEQKLPDGLVVGLVRHGGAEILVLDTNRLVSLAVDRKERRRRRF